jgi:hypothetical protein
MIGFHRPPIRTQSSSSSTSRARHACRWRTAMHSFHVNGYYFILDARTRLPTQAHCQDFCHLSKVDHPMSIQIARLCRRSPTVPQRTRLFMLVSSAKTLTSAEASEKLSGEMIFLKTCERLRSLELRRCPHNNPGQTFFPQ